MSITPSELLEQAPQWACFPTAAHEVAWRRLAPPSMRPCTDCLPVFQAQMIRAGRCRHPGVVFKHIDGELVGLIPGRFGLSRYGSRASADPAASRVGLQLAVQLFGKQAAAALVGLGSGSVPAYLNGTRVLPLAKVAMLRSAILGAARLITARG